GRDSEADAVLADDVWRRRLGRPAIERFLLLDVLLGEPVISTLGKVRRESVLDGLTKAIHPRREKLQHKDRAKSVKDQPGQTVAFRLNDPIGVRYGVKGEPVAAQRNRAANASSEERLVNRFGRIGRQDAQRDPRVAVVKAAPHPLPIAVP